MTSDCFFKALFPRCPLGAFFKVHGTIKKYISSDGERHSSQVVFKPANNTRVLVAGLGGQYWR